MMCIEAEGHYIEKVMAQFLLLVIYKVQGVGNVLIVSRILDGICYIVYRNNYIFFCDYKSPVASRTGYTLIKSDL